MNWGAIGYIIANLFFVFIVGGALFIAGSQALTSKDEGGNYDGSKLAGLLAIGAFVPAFLMSVFFRWHGNYDMHGGVALVLLMLTVIAIGCMFARLNPVAQVLSIVLLVVTLLFYCVWGNPFDTRSESEKTGVSVVSSTEPCSVIDEKFGEELKSRTNIDTAQRASTTGGIEQEYPYLFTNERLASLRSDYASHRKDPCPGGTHVLIDTDPVFDGPRVTFTARAIGPYVEFMWFVDYVGCGMAIRTDEPAPDCQGSPTRTRTYATLSGSQNVSTMSITLPPGTYVVKVKATSLLAQNDNDVDTLTGIVVR